jgi:glutamyl-tRNA synthetase
MTKIRTRIAPSPTGFLHLGTARTALYSWAYARHFGGQFVLRIEDTDVARSSQDSVDQILQSMHWLGLGYDEGPIYQMQRLERYRAVVDQMLQAGTAYRCYCTPEDLEAMKAAQEKRGEKRLYDRTWRPAPGKLLPPIPEGVKPVIRLANPVDGTVSWDDLVKGPINISNTEIDDLIILRADGVPTYNFAVVVDDWDMAISHVFRGDEHINNTPWQINIYRALGAPLPQFGHLPVILGDDGQKLSKRRGAVAVSNYDEAGYLPEAMNNYLARLGWSHGDDEIFSLEQMVQWFDGSHLSKSPAQWDPAKLLWVNAQHLKALSDKVLALRLKPYLKGLATDERLEDICGLFKDRCDTLVGLAQWVRAFYDEVQPQAQDLESHLQPSVRAALDQIEDRLRETEWTPSAIATAFKQVLADTGLKMPQLAMPVRVLVLGTAQTPSVDRVLYLCGREKVLARLAKRQDFWL